MRVQAFFSLKLPGATFSRSIFSLKVSTAMLAEQRASHNGANEKSEGMHKSRDVPNLRGRK